MQTKTFLETERLYVRTWKQGDLDDLHRVMSDPRVHLYTSEEPWSREKTQSIIDFCMRARLGHSPGYFNCPLLRKEGDLLLGRVGLNPYRKEERLPEIEWTLGPDSWGKGYATEIGRAMLRYAFTEAGFPEVVGFAFPDNLGSKRVMTKIGMSPTGQHEFRGLQWDFFAITREEFARLSGA